MLDPQMLDLYCFTCQISLNKELLEKIEGSEYDWISNIMNVASAIILNNNSDILEQFEPKVESPKPDPKPWEPERPKTPEEAKPEDPEIIAQKEKDAKMKERNEQLKTVSEIERAQLNTMESNPELCLKT